VNKKTDDKIQEFYQKPNIAPSIIVMASQDITWQNEVSGVSPLPYGTRHLNTDTLIVNQNLKTYSGIFLNNR